MDKMSQHYQFFSHKQCEYYPCHDLEEINCLFCFCPLYTLGKECGGNYQYIGDVKDCSQCLVPNQKRNYEYMIKKMKENFYK